MRTLFLILISSIIGFTALGQESKTQVVLISKDPGNNILGSATIMRLPDSVSLFTRTVGDTTSFTLPSNKNYYLRITAVGMKPIQRNIQARSTPIRIEFKWIPSVNNLQNVTVVSRKPLVTQEDDKTIVDAEVLANSSTNAFEVLEKTPGAVVDQDGNVYLNSATPATIQINGRDIKLNTADLASLLKSLPANSVVKIEIIRTPSAKYDASSSGGVINIVLKKGIKIGTNGSVNAGFFQGRLNTFTSGFNVNRSTDKINSNISYQFTDRNNYEELNSSRASGNDQFIQQSAYTKYPATNHYIGGGIDMAFTKQLNVGYDVRFTANQGKSRALNNIDFLRLPGYTATSHSTSLIQNDNSSYYLGNNISGILKIDSLGSKWEFDIDYNYFNSGNGQYYSNRFERMADSTVNGNGTIDGNKHIFVAESDLLLKLAQKTILETGFKLNYSNSKNSALYEVNYNGSGFILDSFQSNKFSYRERISSAYLQVSKTIRGLIIKPGARIEHTDIRGNQMFPMDTSLRIKRSDIFPYIYLRHKLMKLFGFTLTGNAIYRRSISRPYYEALNPYPRYIDQLLYEVGNPLLRPQFTTNYEFNIMADDFPVFSAGINDIQDIFTGVTYSGFIDSNKVLFRTYDNLGSNKEMYLRLVGGIPPGGKYFFYAGGQHNYSNYKGFYQGVPLDYKRGSWVFFMYHNYKPRTDLSMTVNGFMRLRGLQSFYEIKTFGALNISINKSFLNKKMNVILAANDILRTNKYAFSIDQGINATGSRVNDTRRIGITVRYNFGIKPKEESKNLFEAPADIAN